MKEAEDRVRVSSLPGPHAEGIAQRRSGSPRAEKWPSARIVRRCCNSDTRLGVVGPSLYRRWREGEPGPGSATLPWLRSSTGAVRQIKGRARVGTVSPERQKEMSGLEFVNGFASGALPLNTIAKTMTWLSGRS